LHLARNASTHRLIRFCNLTRHATATIAGNGCMTCFPCLAID